MKRAFLAVGIFLAVVLPSFAGSAGLIVKGAFHSWDEVAKMALKVSGKNASDDAVKTAAKTIQAVAKEYGDDVAEACARGGLEVAEQTTKRGGGRFLQLVKVAGHYSDDSLRFLALHADDVLKYSSQYGDDIVRLNAKVPGLVPRTASVLEKSGASGVQTAMRAMADLPAEEIPMVVGAIEKNPSVAKEFVEHLEKGGKLFIDKLFAVNAKQIMAGGLTTSMIVLASGASETMQDVGERVTEPFKANADAIRQQSDTAITIVTNLDTDAKRVFVKDVVNQTGEGTGKLFDSVLYPAIILASFIGLAILLFAIRKTRLKPVQRGVVPNPDIPKKEIEDKSDVPSEEG